MKKDKLIIWLVCGAMALSLAGCASGSVFGPEPTPSPTPVVDGPEDTVPAGEVQVSVSAAAPNTTLCRVRAGTGVAYAVFPRGSVLDITGEFEDYYVFQTDGTQVYIEKQFVRLSYAAVPDEQTFVSDRAFPVYASAYLTGEPVGIVSKGDTVTVLDQFGGYLYIRSGETTGYISENMIGARIEATFLAGRKQGDVSGTAANNDAGGVIGDAVADGAQEGSGTQTGEGGTSEEPAGGESGGSTWDNIKNGIASAYENGTIQGAVDWFVDAAGDSDEREKAGEIIGQVIDGLSGAAGSTDEGEDGEASGGGLSTGGERGYVALASVSGQIKPMLATGTVLTDDAEAYLYFCSRGDTIQVLWHDSSNCIVYANGVYGNISPLLVQFPGQEDYTIWNGTVTADTVLYRDYRLTEPECQILQGTDIMVLDEIAGTLLVEADGNSGYLLKDLAGQK